MLRWHLLQWRGWQIALHKWLTSDNDRALHDHRADNISILLWGTYREVLTHAWESVVRNPLRIPGIPYFRRAETPHRVVLHRGAPVWTLWIRFPPRRTWGFYCPKGWVPYSVFIGDYSQPGSFSTMNKGCDE